MSARRGTTRHLAVLFGLLALGLVAIAVYAGLAGVWLVAAAAGVLAVWMGELAVRSVR